MSHDKFKAAVRQRMARTGECYMVARRAVIREHQAVQRSNQPAESTRPVTSGVVASWESVAQSPVVRQVMEVAQSGAVRQAIEARRAVMDHVAQVAETQRVVNQVAQSGVLGQILEAQRAVMDHIAQPWQSF